MALPTIRNDLGMAQVASHWVIDSYLLVFTCLAAAGGKFGDIMGHKWTAIGAAGLFGVSSLVCGFAPDGTWLIAARIAQGVGAAAVFPISMAMVAIAFPLAGSLTVVGYALLGWAWKRARVVPGAIAIALIVTALAFGVGLSPLGGIQVARITAALFGAALVAVGVWVAQSGARGAR